MQHKPQTYTITEFCDTHHVGRSTFYELVRSGKGPRLMKVGKRTLISAEAAAEWRRRMEEQPTEQAAR